MKKVLLLVLSLAMVMCLLTACGDKHEHTYSDEWTVDENNHWHVANCDHTDKVASKGGHVDANDDGACDMCGHGEVHMHTYTDVWSSDETGHWHMATCDGHTNVKGDVYAHVNSDGDAKCDRCGYEVAYTVSVEIDEDIDVAEEIYVDKATGKATFTASVMTGIEVSTDDATLVGEPAEVDGVTTYTFELSGITANGSISLHGRRTVFASVVASGTEEGVEFVQGMFYGYEASAEKTVSLKPGNYVVKASANEDVYVNTALLDADNVEVEYDFETGYKVTEAGEYKVIAIATTYAYTYESVDISFAVLTTYGDTAVIDATEGSYVFPAGDMFVTYVPTESGLYVISTTSEGTQIDGVEGAALVYFVAGEEVEFSVYNASPEGIYEFDWTIAPATASAELVEGDNTVVINLGGETVVSFTAPADGNYSFVAALGSYVKALDEESGSFVYVWDDTQVELNEGDVIILVLNNYNDEIYDDEGVLNETVTVTYSQADTILSVEVTDNNAWADYYEITATASGTYTFWFPEYLAVWLKSDYDNNMAPLVDPYFMYEPQVAEYSVDLAEGEVLGFYIGAVEVGEFEIRYNWVEGSVSGGTEEPVGNVLYVGENVGNAGMADVNIGIEYSFTATVGGDYTIEATGVSYFLNGTSPFMGGTLTLAEGETVNLVVFPMMPGQFTVTITAPAGNSGSSESENAPLAIGSTIQINAEDAVYEYTADAAGTLNIAVDASIMFDVAISYSVNGGDSNVIAISSNVDIVLAAGDVVVVTIVANGGYSSLTATWTAA